MHVYKCVCIDACMNERILLAPNLGRTQRVRIQLWDFEVLGFGFWQWRQASELVVEVGDQRRNIAIPIGMRGKVVGAKFEGRTLTVTLTKQ